MSNPQGDRQRIMAGLGRETVAGLIVLGAGAVISGVVFLGFTLPEEVSQLLTRQQMIRTTQERIWERLENHHERIIRLEAQR
jgi:hypothetical protein